MAAVSEGVTKAFAVNGIRQVAGLSHDCVAAAVWEERDREHAVDPVAKSYLRSAEAGPSGLGRPRRGDWETPYTGRRFDAGRHLTRLPWRAGSLGKEKPPSLGWRGRGVQGRVASAAEHAVPHGFRSSFLDWRRSGRTHPREVVEAALAHAVRDQIEAGYARSDLFEPRGHLMDDCANYLRAPRGQVVTLGR